MGDLRYVWTMPVMLLEFPETIVVAAITYSSRKTDTQSTPTRMPTAGGADLASLASVIHLAGHIHYPQALILGHNHPYRHIHVRKAFEG